MRFRRIIFEWSGTVRRTSGTRPGLSEVQHLPTRTRLNGDQGHILQRQASNGARCSQAVAWYWPMSLHSWPPSTGRGG